LVVLPKRDELAAAANAGAAVEKPLCALRCDERPVF
jgi:hypothetical protein